MDQKIIELLEHLNDVEVLKMLPCFYDKPGEIQFRIGISNGSQIIFGPQYGIYYLFIGNAELNYSRPIPVGSDDFGKCQQIYLKITGLNREDGYNDTVEEKIGILTANLSEVIKPIMDKLTN